MPTALEERFEGVATGAVRVRPIRTERFDLRGSLFFSPMGYATEQMPQADGSPPNDLLGAFGNFVRDEFGSRLVDASAPPRLPTSEDHSQTGKRLDFLEAAAALVESVEKRLVYGEQPRAVEARLTDSAPAEQLYELFCGDDFGRRENSTNVSPSWFEEQLKRRLDPRTGVHFVIPCLPYRDQNRFRSPNVPGIVTLAEVVFLAWLHSLSLAVYRLLTGGAHVICLTDGLLYAETLGVSTDAAAQYFENMRHARDAMNLSRTVSLIDLRLVAERVAHAAGTDFWSLVGNIKADLRRNVSSDDQAIRSLCSLVGGIRWNVADNILGNSQADIWKVLTRSPEDCRAPGSDRTLD